LKSFFLLSHLALGFHLWTEWRLACAFASASRCACVACAGLTGPGLTGQALQEWDEVLEEELMELRSGELAFLATRPKVIQAGYTTLDSIPRIQKRSGTRFYCPALEGVDSRTQGQVSQWIQLLHKHPAHLRALDMKDAQKQRDPGIKPLAGMTISKLADKYIIKRNKIRNQITHLRGHVEAGVVFFFDDDDCFYYYEK